MSCTVYTCGGKVVAGYGHAKCIYNIYTYVSLFVPIGGGGGGGGVAGYRLT